MGILAVTVPAQRPMLLHWTARIALGGLLSGLAILKVTHLPDDHSHLPGLVLLGAAAIELSLGGLILSRWSKVGAIGALVFFAGATAFSWVYAEECGCLGGLGKESQLLRIAVAGMGGVLSCLLLEGCKMHAQDIKTR